MSSKSRTLPPLENNPSELEEILKEFQEFLDLKRKRKLLKSSYDVNKYREELVNYLLQDLLTSRQPEVNGVSHSEQKPSPTQGICTVVTVKDEPFDMALVNGNTSNTANSENSLLEFLKEMKPSTSSVEADEMPELEPATQDDSMPELEAQITNEDDSDEDDITSGENVLHSLALNLFAATVKKKTATSRREASSSEDDRQRTKLPKYRERKSTSFVPNNEEVAEKEDADEECSNWPYAFMISLALLENEATETRSIHDIYRFVEDHFPYFRTSVMNWRDCVRSSLKAYFRKPYNSVPSRNPLYTFNEEKKATLFTKLAEFLENENVKKAAENFDYFESILIRAKILKKKAPKRSCREANKTAAELLLDQVEQVEKKTTPAKKTRK